MDRQELEKKIMRMVSTTYDADIESLSGSTNLKTDLAGTSLMMVGLVSEIENELDVMIPLQLAAKCDTIHDLVDRVEAEL